MRVRAEPKLECLLARQRDARAKIHDSPTLLSRTAGSGSADTSLSALIAMRFIERRTRQSADILLTMATKSQSDEGVPAASSRVLESPRSPTPPILDEPRTLIPRDDMVVLVARLLRYTTEFKTSDRRPGLQADTEDVLATLWDLSSMPDEADVIMELNIVDIACELIHTVTAEEGDGRSRLVEECVGLFANLAALGINLLSTHKRLRDLVLSELIFSSDSLTLVQVFRFLLSSFSNSDDEDGDELCDIAQDQLRLFTTSEARFHLSFILQNSLSIDVINSCLDVIDRVLAYDETDALPTSQLVVALSDLITEHLRDSSLLMKIARCLYQMSTTDNGVVCLLCEHPVLDALEAARGAVDDRQTRGLLTDVINLIIENQSLVK